MHDFILALAGGAMIGLSAVLLMATHGKIMGVSGILSQSLSSFSSGNHWRISFLLGVVAAPVLSMLIIGYKPVVEITGSVVLLIAGGILAGVGTVLGNGCTSGHGVCGVSRFSTRSIFATAVFMVTAIITVWVMNAVTGA